MEKLYIGREVDSTIVTIIQMDLQDWQLSQNTCNKYYSDFPQKGYRVTSSLGAQQWYSIASFPLYYRELNNNEISLVLKHNNK